MLFKQFRTPGLEHYAYAVGDRHRGEIAIIDPVRDVDAYIRYARFHRARISTVLETHIDADHVSGSRELLEKTGASLYLSAYDLGEKYEVRFPREKLHDGDHITIGRVRLEIIHSPGHTPEHLSFLVYDSERSDTLPMLMLSGDFLLVGGLGRPDLLGEETCETLVGKMFGSVRKKLAGLPDGLAIYPAHGAGSLCGSGVSERRSTTLGYERATNPCLSPALSQERFRELLLENLPHYPSYFAEMKRVNSEGPPLLNGLPGNWPVAPRDFQRLSKQDHVVIDLREPAAFGAGHVPGAYGIGGGEWLSPWAGWVVPRGHPILLVAKGRPEVEEGIRSLVRVGLDNIAGYLRGGMGGWRRAGFPLSVIPEISPFEAAHLSGAGKIGILDVRPAAEWASGHIAGSHHLSAAELLKSPDKIGAEAVPMAVVCGSGYVSNMAASLLVRAGFRNISHISGGIAGWREAGLPLVPAQRRPNG